MQQQLKKLDAPQNSTGASESVSKIKNDETPTKLKKPPISLTRGTGGRKMFKDDQDGAAITLNDNGTGRYVYADPTSIDTDDQLNWKNNSDGYYTITLHDSNVTSPLTGKLDGSKLILSGDYNWNTEEFTKAKVENVD